MAEKVAYSIHEVAAVLGISVPVAYELARRPGFPAIRVSERRIIVPARALEAWMLRETGFVPVEGIEGGDAS